MTPHPKLAKFAWATLAWNGFVILWGAYVRASGSGAGCGSHWPTCNGEVVPRDPSIATVIEFTHRATSGVALLMVLGLMVGVLMRATRGHPARGAAVASFLFIVLEAAIGAGLVLFEWVAGSRAMARGIVMPLHLVNTFLLLGALIFTAWHLGGGKRFSLLGPGSQRGAFLGACGSLMLAAASGGIAALGDTLFPARSLSDGFAQDLSAGSHLFLQLRTLHPLFAVLAAGTTIAFGIGAKVSAPRMGSALLGLVGLQLVVGVVNVLLLAPTWMQLVHLVLADAVWCVFLLAFAEARTAEVAAQPVVEPVAVAPNPTV